jgi:hypothetical protein
LRAPGESGSKATAAAWRAAEHGRRIDNTIGRSFLGCGGGGEFALEESIFRAVQARSVRDFPGEEARGGRSDDAQPNPPEAAARRPCRGRDRGPGDREDGREHEGGGGRGAAERAALAAGAAAAPRRAPAAGPAPAPALPLAHAAGSRGGVDGGGGRRGRVGAQREEGKVVGGRGGAAGACGFAHDRSAEAGLGAEGGGHPPGAGGRTGVRAHPHATR